jgi:IS5 family transposase
VQGVAVLDRELLDAESLVRHLVPAGSVFAFLADHRRGLFPDGMFADLFPASTGRPSVPCDVVASVIVLQALHGLSDREAVEALRCDLRWKVACGLALTDEGFHPSTLTYWRRRLAASSAPNRIFDVVKAVVAATGLLTGKTRRALDSTVLDDAVATRDTVTQLIAAVRRVGREVPGAGVVIATECLAHDYTDPGKPAIAWDDLAARDVLVDALVTDARRLLTRLEVVADDPKAAEALALLALVAGQDVEWVAGDDTDEDHPRGGSWRIARQVAADRVISVVDPEARHAHKTVHRRQDGFKAHVAVEPDTGIFTDCTLTRATGPGNHEAVVGVGLLEREEPGLEVLGDSAYGTGEARAKLGEAGHTGVIKPIPLRAAVHDGFTADDFTVDERVGTVTCPAGLTRPITGKRSVTFGAACRDCPLRARCTTAARGRTLRLHEHEALLRAARRHAKTEAFQTVYRQHRPMVERSIAWLTRGNRKVRYRGVAKNNAWLHHRVAALNLRRLLALGLVNQDGSWALA